MPGAWERFLDSDFIYGFRRSPMAMVSAVVLLLFFLIALLAPWLAPQNPFDPAALDLMNSRLPPAWIEGGQIKFPLGTDGQGRDLLSVLMYGLRISLFVSFCATLFSLVLGVTLGLISGYAGGRVDNVIMRLADMQLSFPTILVALLIDGLSRALLPRSVHEQLALFVVVFAIGISTWVQYARTACAGDRHALARAGHPDRGDAQLPGTGSPAHITFSWHADPHWQRGAFFGRMVGHRDARRVPDHLGAGHQFAGRLATRHL